jgi:hypothetical protein
MISINQFEKLIKEIEQELIILRKTTPESMISLLEKEAEEAIRAELVHENNWDNCSNDTHEIHLKELCDKSHRAVKKFQEWKQDPTLASKSLKDKIALKEKMLCLIEAAKA